MEADAVRVAETPLTDPVPVIDADVLSRLIVAAERQIALPPADEVPLIPRGKRQRVEIDRYGGPEIICDTPERDVAAECTCSGTREGTAVNRR